MVDREVRLLFNLGALGRFRNPKSEIPEIRISDLGKFLEIDPGLIRYPGYKLSQNSFLSRRKPLFLGFFSFE